MIAFKGFKKDLVCTKGYGKFKYEVGKTYKEDKCKVASNGFHCVEEPIRVLDWYEDRFCVVEISGDINEKDNKITATEMTILKEIDLIQLATYECVWIQNHPDREMSSRIMKDTGTAQNDFVIVRGKNPMAAGKKGATLFLLKESKNSKKIEKITAIYIDGDDIKENQYYNIKQEVVKRARKRYTSQYSYS